MTQHPVNRAIIVAAVVAVFLALPIALAILGGWGMWRESQTHQAQPAEGNEALRESLERAADVAFPAPTLGAEALTVECAPEDFEKEVQRIVRLAGGVGGSASSWNDGGSVRIVANVPDSAEGLFRDAVTGGVYDLTSAGDGGPASMIEVLITPVR